ncbi:hypothetical protein D3C74_309050 [compost metagenome]
MVRRDVLDDAQAQARAARVARARGVDPVEALEHALLLALGDPDALVDDRDLDEVSHDAHADPDPRVLARVGDRVVEQVADRGHEQRVVAVDDRVEVSADRQDDALALGVGARPVDGLLDHAAHGHGRDGLERAGDLEARELDDLLDQRGQARGLLLHAPREAADRDRVVRRVLDGLGEQRERPHRRLELVRDVDDEVAADRVDAPCLGPVLREHEDVVRSDLRDPDLEHDHAATDGAARELELLVADHAVALDLGDHVEDRGVHDRVAPHHAQGVGGRARPHDLALAVEDHGGRAQHREHAHEPFVELGGLAVGHAVRAALAEPERERREHADEQPDDPGDEQPDALLDSFHGSSVRSETAAPDRSWPFRDGSVTARPRVHLAASCRSPDRSPPRSPGLTWWGLLVTMKGMRCGKSSRPSSSRSVTTLPR